MNYARAVCLKRDTYGSSKRGDEQSSLLIQPKRSTHDAARRIHFNIRGNKWCWVYEGDFQACFDTLNHEFILKGFLTIILLKDF